MKIAVAYENGDIFQHFGHTEKFKIYETKEGAVLSSSVIDTEGSGHGALADFLKNHNVNLLICGGIGGGAKNALADAGIELRGGVSGSADKAVASLLSGELSFNPNIECTHHDHEHGEDCGSHEHGSSCGNCGQH